jgi:hypothetical protein
MIQQSAGDRQQQPFTRLSAHHVNFSALKVYNACGWGAERQIRKIANAGFRKQKDQCNPLASNLTADRLILGPFAAFEP